MNPLDQVQSKPEVARPEGKTSSKLSLQDLGQRLAELVPEREAESSPKASLKPERRLGEAPRTELGTQLAAQKPAAPSRNLPSRSNLTWTFSGASPFAPEPEQPAPSDPIQEELHPQLPPPAGFEPGSEVPTFPSFEGQLPSNSQTLATGQERQTFVEEGITYTQTQSPDGTVQLTYVEDGITYSQTQRADGSSSVMLATSNDDGTFNRVVDTDAQGQPTDTFTAAEASNGGTSSVVHQLGPEGQVTRQESVVRADGGQATTELTQSADGQFEEVYSFEGPQGSVSRTTQGQVEGARESRVERSYTSERPLEELVDAPPVPSEPSNVVPLPEEGRGPTQIHEIEVTHQDSPSAPAQVQYQESVYSQTSQDVQLTGDSELGTSQYDDTFPDTIAPASQGSQITHTVAVISGRDENGELVTVQSGTQELTVAGQRLPELAPEGVDLEVSATRIDSWNSAGESSISFQTKGFLAEDLYSQSVSQADVVSDIPDFFVVQVGDQRVTAGPPQTGRSLFDHLNMKGGGEAQDWLGADPQSPLDLNVSVNFDSQGELSQEIITYSTLDAQGDGKVVTRSEIGQTVAWVYQENSNQGQDYRRQTVFEGTELSIFEEREQLGPDTFRASSETREGDQIIASTRSSRVEAGQAELDQMLEQGQISRQQWLDLKEEGPPYFLSTSLDNTEPLYDGDGLRLDSEGQPLQPGHHVSSFQIENSQGNSVSEHYRIDYGETPGQYTDSRVRTQVNPEGQPPYVASISQGQDGKELESAQLEMDQQGRLLLDGEEVAQYDLEGLEVDELMADSSLFQPLSLFAPGVDAAQLARGGGPGRLRLTGEAAHFQRFAAASDVLSLVTGTQSMWQGIQNGDGRQVLEGAGSVAGSLESVAAATSALTKRLGINLVAQYTDEVSSLASKGRLGLGTSRFLGAAGGFVQAAFGVYDLFQADNGYDRAAAGLNVAAGSVAITSAFLGPPGWVIGGLVSGGLTLASFFVAAGDANQTSGIDPRML